jgi:hypothetical protein
MYSELQRTHGWTDLDIFKITYDEYMAFSRQYMAGQIALNPLSLAPNSYASSTDSVALFTKSIKREPKDFPALHPHFTWLPTHIIKKTFEVTTQYARMPLNTILRKCFKSPNPAVNVRRRDEPIATDTIQSDVPAIDGGEKYTQIFVRTKSLVTDVHGMKSPAQFPGVLTDEIITRGAPTKLISDSARVKTSKEVHSILRTYGISSWQSEPHQQHQNPAEQRYQTVKQLCNTILDQTGAPAYCWLLCLMYVCFVLNNAFSEVIQSTPLCQAYGTDNDISPMLDFSFCELVYYLVDETTFPSKSKELRR